MKIKIRAMLSLAAALSLIGCTSTNFSEYKDLPGHKSIAVGSNGVIAYSSSNPNVETAITTAIDKCSSIGGKDCKFIDVDGYSPIGNKTYMYDDRAASVDYLDKGSYKVRYKCEQLTKAMAQSLFHSGHTYLDGDSDGKPCESNLWSSYYSTDTNSRKVKGTNCHYVRGYRRKNGTYVSGYTRCR